MEVIQSGQWHKNDHGIDKETLIAFRNVKDSLSVNSNQDMILNGSRLVIPLAFQDDAVKLAHE